MLVMTNLSIRSRVRSGLHEHDDAGDDIARAYAAAQDWWNCTGHTGTGLDWFTEQRWKMCSICIK